MIQYPITQIAVAIFDKCANQYQDKFMDMDLYNDTFDLFCDAVEKEDAHILEIACGPGNITRYLLKKRPNYKILGTDLSPKMIDLAKANNPMAEFRLMDCRDISKLEESYDAIMGGFCLPYLSKEESLKLIHDASELLKPNGVIYLSTMEDDYNKSGFKASSSGGPDKLYIYYHQADYLTNALKKYGFKILDLQRRAYPEENGTSTTDLLILAKKSATID